MDDEPLERSEQLAALDAHWQAIRAEQRGRLVVIGGEAGVGKTALVRMFCDRVPGGTRVLTGACDALYTPRPLGPFVDIAAAGQPVREAIMSGGRPDEVAVALLEDADVPGPTIVVLEDLHWADEATIDVLRLLARRVDSYRVLVLATYRDDELDRMHPFRVFLGDLSAQLVRLRVPTLTEEAVFELAVRAGVDGRELSLKTGGNPFFVSEVLASPGEEIPDSVRDAVLARVARLGPAGHAVIEAIAVVPHAAELWLVDALVHDDGEGLERCIESGVVTDVEGAVGFRHELARLAVEASLSPVRRTALHHSVMRALAERPASAADSARLAHHAAAAGDAAAVVRYAPEAAVQAVALGAYREAAAQYAKALKYAEQLEPGTRAELFERHAEVCYLADEPEDAVASNAAAAAIFHELGESLREADALLKLATAQRINGQVTDTAESVQAALALLEQSPPGRELAMAFATSAQAAMCNGDKAGTLAAGSRALQLAEELGDTETLIHVLTTLGTLEAEGTETLEDGRKKLFRSIRLAKESGLHELVGRAYNNLAYVAFVELDLAGADTAIEEALEYSSRFGLDVWRYCAVGSRSELELFQGDWDKAMDTADSVLSGAEAPVLRMGPLTVRGLIRARRGDPDAWGPLDEAYAIAKRSGELQGMVLVAAARAEAAWLEGRDEDIVGETDHLVERALRGRDYWALGELAHWRRKAGLSEEITKWGTPPRRLESSSRAGEAAAEWASLGYPYEAALASAESGEVEALRAALDGLNMLGARAAATRVARTLRELGVRGIPRGPRMATAQTPGLLTRREVEVVQLVAQGLRDGEIAQRLFLSEKTVGNHLAAIFRKLGVRTRAQATREVVRLGLVDRNPG